MVYAYLTTFLFALSSVLASRSQRAVGTVWANLGRLTVGSIVLGIWAGTIGTGFSGPSLLLFVLSGATGMGLGDVGFFAALPLLGSRLTIMITQCLSVPTAIIVEWLWLDTRLTPAQLVASAVVLAGIAVALMPTKSNPPRVKVRGYGAVFGVLAAVGQGVGAVLSRRGFGLATAAGQPIDGLTAAFQRMLGGIVVAAVYYGVRRLWRKPAAPGMAPEVRRGAGGWGWVLAHGVVGPVLAMGMFQFALASEPSGIVLPITATAPLVVIPLAFWFEGERPSRRSLGGGVIAVAGAITLTLA